MHMLCSLVDVIGVCSVGVPYDEMRRLRFPNSPNGAAGNLHSRPI
jgi:hypothetical protein